MKPSPPPGVVIFINGTSSAGKTTISKALQASIGVPFCYYASDQLAEKGFRPPLEFDAPPNERDRFFDGFHRSIPALATAGNNLIVEHIVEELSWAASLQALLSPFDVFWVGVHAPVGQLEKRERERGDRTIGEALFHLKTHKYCHYDIEVDSTEPLEKVVSSILAAWQSRKTFR